MQITIKYDGETYKSKTTDEGDPVEIAEKFYDIGGKLDSFKMELENGDMLVLPKAAIQRAHMIFHA